MYPRYAHEAAITIDAGSRAIAGRTRNVSRGGVCVTLAEALVVGVDLVVDLQLVFSGDQQSEALTLPARAVWCTAVDDVYQVGLRFLALAPEAADDLTMFLRYLDDAARAAPPERSRALAASASASVSMSIDERFG